MTKERKILLIILGSLLLAFGFQLGYSTLNQQRDDLKNKIQLNKNLISSLLAANDKASEQSIELESRVINLYNSFLITESHYQFGQRIKEDLISRGFNISKYQELTTSNGDEFEFHLEGSPFQILSFLESLSLEDTFYKVSYLNIDSQRNPALINFRIAPARLISNISPPPVKEAIYPIEPIFHTTPAIQLQQIFYGQWNHVTTTITPEPIVVENNNIIRQTHRLDFVGTVKTEESGIMLYFKDLTTQNMISINPNGLVNNQGWSLIEESEQFYILEKEGIQYEVSK